MPELSSGMTHRTLSDIFHWVEENELALPELQRPSVWGSSKVPSLLSSVYSDYPFGIMLIWTPKKAERIHCKPFIFQQDKSYDTKRQAAHYLIDGQQRLTSFFRSLHKDGDLTVAFNLRTEEFALPDAKIKEMLKDPLKNCWYKLKDLLALGTIETAELMSRHADLGKNQLETVFGNKGSLQRLQPDKISISFYNIHEKTYGDVAEIFQRINLGTPVKQSQIALGKLSTVYPGVVGEVEAYLELMRKKNGYRFALDLFMSSFAAIATDFADVENLGKRYLQGKMPAETVKKDVDRTKNALIKALAFIEEKLFIDTMKYFPSERTLTFLAYLNDARPDLMANAANANRVALWTALAVLGSHHGDYRRLCKDISAIRDADSDEEALKRLFEYMKTANVKSEVRAQLSSLTDMESPISRNNVLFGFLYAITRWKNAVSFMSRVPIKTAIVDDTEDEEETTDENTIRHDAIHEHHIYPAAQLKKEAQQQESKWNTKPWIFDLANFTFLTGEDNLNLKDPSIEYLFVLPQDIRESHSIDPTRQYRSGQYEKFIVDRRKIIRRNLDEFLKKLEQDADNA
jgi:hypothetical protein